MPSGHDGCPRGDREASWELVLASSPALAALWYHRWRWPVEVSGGHLLLTTGPEVCGVEAPEPLARRVYRFLAARLVAGPVIGLPGVRRRSVLLARSAEGASPTTIGRLDRRGVVVHRSGAVLPMPPSRLASGLVAWRVAPALPPTPHSGRPWLPPFAAIVAALRRSPSREE
ncbi:hypothetical protein LX15_004429 [Streptoalloteichus tenebrarius]|uniref:Uncharacterized protein n=1 Tax=Streptoalloteichus tenebrarius (strain ATCC 17920 / DSM 40477 / JCM 4838 / CBS 697.72 / NBRC 16177 / NCIMB 11028 / NRRL B-12390 / A12253. 1 / ISP 5477) TaxID=1933 RepID=A0ABT1HYY9_STRSD|nr:hypothetical protein [Streptoalloteichus tenebrarius]MCP2260709.1 hypothetical protein [Streptoalloteichus tenebrarius]BFF03757.1 hypothetical protein GCM10020241_54320 [Streptoalloteichus tenebrarius]